MSINLVLLHNFVKLAASNMTEEEKEEDDRLRDFADAVKQACAKAPEKYRFGRYKVFIAYLDPLKSTKRMLVEAHRRGYLTLARADLTPAMDPELVRKSEIQYGPATWHFIDLESMKDRF